MDSEINKIFKSMASRGGFVTDENGKLRIEPMDITGLFGVHSASKSSGGKRSTTRRKLIPIEPLILTAADFGEESPQQTNKRRKVDRPVRKELFKVPQLRPSSRLSEANRQSVAPSYSTHQYKRNSINKKLNSIKKKVGKSEGCTLLDISEVDEAPLNENRAQEGSIKTVLFPVSPSKKENNGHEAPLNDKRAQQDSTKNVLFPLSPLKKENNGHTPLSQLKDKNEITPKSSGSADEELEFLKLERETASPVTSVCALLENTKITSVGGKTNKDNAVCNILTLLQQDLQESEILRQQWEKFQEEHKNRLCKVIELLENIEGNKENGRRSLRIATQGVKNKFVVSPAIGSKVDLRKTTLHKNWSKNVQCESPRMKKAVDLYNSMRNDCAVLCTPKMDKTHINMPQTSVTRSLSRRIQKQCLLLQDTPKPS